MSKNTEIQEVLEKLKNIETKEKEKNDWFKLQIIIQSIGVVLIPIVIVYITHNLSEKTTEREYQLARISTEAMDKQASVEEAMAIKNLVDLLTDNNKLKRELGIISLEFMLEKEDAEKILTKISQKEKDSNLKKTAEKTLESVVNKINEKNKIEFKNLFSKTRIIRQQSLYYLRKKQWQAFEVETIRDAINYAYKNIDNTEIKNDLGVVNTLIIFLKMSENAESKYLLIRNKNILQNLLNKGKKSSNEYVKYYAKRVEKSLY